MGDGRMNKRIGSIEAIFDAISIKDGMTLSFHHHLRNGDHVINMVLAEIKRRNLHDMTLAPSSLFSIHEPLVELMEKGQVTKIVTNYVNGPVAKAISTGKLKGELIMDTHGGRARAIEEGDLPIDVAFLAVPTTDEHGNGTGSYGPSACGTLGYAIPDLLYAKQKVVITDHLADHVDTPDIDGDRVDYVLVVDRIGDAKDIVSGTTSPTRDPIQTKIARDTARLIDELGLIQNGLSFQTGAGKTSIAVAKALEDIMVKRGIKGSFASGGITGHLVRMFEKGLFERLYDVQCFDLEAVSSYYRNKNHIMMSSSKYANPHREDAIVNKLDVVCLGATEVDLDFNVNVTTDSFGYLIGGSGGHADTAAGAKLTIITTSLIKARLPLIKERVTTITTPGHTVDCIVTERGIAINPARTDLIDRLFHSKLDIVPIEKLMTMTHEMTGIPEDPISREHVIGRVRARDGSTTDYLYLVKDGHDDLPNG
jgi:citrate lyase subunit alpha / citrate CoA-transferase